ncbi:Pyrrolo-quinoline quinone [Minicystis rosea]|nr:Pyrrolo-quinoline quinone [Minicystis rosea]
MHGLTLVVARPTASLLEPDRLSPVHALLEALTEGASFRPRVGSAELSPLLCDLAAAAESLAVRDRARVTVRLPVQPEPWEMGLERAGREVLLSVFQSSGVPEVALHERRLDGEAFAARILAALRAESDDAVRGAAERLAAALPFGEGAGPCEPEVVTVEPTGDVPIVIAADALLRPPSDAAPTSAATVLRADLASLLFRGKIRITVGEHARELPEVFVFPVAEQLAAIALEAVEAWTRGRPYYRRLTVAGAILGVKLEAERAASLTLGIPRRPLEPRAQTWTFPAMDVTALAQGVVAFGRALVRSITRRDRAQTSNLRVHAFRARLRELSDRLRDATHDDSKINESPERYRAFAASVKPPQSGEGSLSRARLRFSARWMAAVPSIDLRSTFLCGDRIIVGSAREITCLDTRSGAPMWRRPVPRAISVMTPLGLARLEPDGQLGFFDLASGEPTWTTRLGPRVGTTASGVVVSAPGLPRMLIVSEGARHLAAVDLHGGEIKWRFAARRGGVFRLRRAGKLVIVASGDPALSALDVLTGEVVWRFCDRLRFASHVAVDHDALFAIAGGGAFVGRGGARLHHLDPWSGECRWSVDLPEHMAPVGAPLLGPETVIVATHGQHGTKLVGFDRRTGALRFDTAAASSEASCLMVDGTVIVNSEAGELVGVSADDGSTRYRHVFAGNDGDRPRRLEPVLRSGALFVPQSEVHVVRPRDGALIGKVPNDIIPDLLRVDDRCDVYVAEESGHLGAYEAGPRLTLVTPVQ